jgi:hypothetical protein
MPSSVHVEVVVDKAVLGRVPLQVLWSSHVNIITRCLSMLMYCLGINNRPIVATVQRCNLTPST